jgi:hypothetical protein
LPEPGTVEFHVSAHDNTGSAVAEPIWRDMDQYADLRTLPEARDWARKTIQADPRVDHCRIRESVKGPHGTGWTPGRHLETVKRPPSPEQLRDLAAQVRTAGLQPAPAPILSRVRPRSRS